MFDKEKFDDLCWMMTMKKNFKRAPQGALLSERDCFKLFCLFNLLSEDRYPLVMIPEEVKADRRENKHGKTGSWVQWRTFNVVLIETRLIRDRLSP